MSGSNGALVVSFSLSKCGVRLNMLLPINSQRYDCFPSRDADARSKSAERCAGFTRSSMSTLHDDFLSNDRGTTGSKTRVTGYGRSGAPADQLQGVGRQNIGGVGCSQNARIVFPHQPAFFADYLKGRRLLRASS